VDLAPHADLSIGVSFLQPSQTAATSGLSPMGLAIMVVSIGAILTLLVWCYTRLLFGGPRPGEED